MKQNRIYDKFGHMSRFFNRWDLLLLVIVLAIFFFLGWTSEQMGRPYALGEPLHISLDPLNLPGYALRTVLRLFIALLFSVIFSFIVGTIAAKNRHAERIIIPAIDVMQAVPVLSFLAITVIGFIRFFPGSLLGPECASIFAVFVSQVWNITFSFYQSLKTVPSDLREVSSMFQLSAWQFFWKVEVPCSVSSLLWNMMVSMSASWFFVVLSEAIVVGHQNIRLPGIGSYIALAIEQHNVHALFYAIIMMLIVIFLYDQILFRPLITWSERFKMEEAPQEEEYQSWLVDLIRLSPMMQRADNVLQEMKDRFINFRWLRLRGLGMRQEIQQKKARRMDWLWSVLLFLAIGFTTYRLLTYILVTLSGYEVLHVFLLGAATAMRVIVLIVLSSVVWIPIGVWIGQRPYWTQKMQPIIQFVAAFPANLFYPMVVIAIVRWHLNVEIWLTPLMILGTQWYILFNVIAGASLIPRDLYSVADNFGVTGWQWWRRLALPGIFPYYITGAITAAGGAWNASIVAEAVTWGSVRLQATGLGEYIQANAIVGNFPKIALGTAVMCIYVLVCNHIIWRPLYRLAQERYHFM
ncbi:MAG: ABC transporter permease subunit [Legionellaceae bacterium]|nr:ABC transporter permease subunit [Legionellaceae bacterium]MBP9775313.1 ABC transporter permease subunit [Legionellaceae bacterium]